MCSLWGRIANFLTCFCRCAFNNMQESAGTFFIAPRVMAEASIKGTAGEAAYKICHHTQLWDPYRVLCCTRVWYTPCPSQLFLAQAGGLFWTPRLREYKKNLVCSRLGVLFGLVRMSVVCKTAEWAGPSLNVQAARRRKKMIWINLQSNTPGWQQRHILWKAVLGSCAPREVVSLHIHQNICKLPFPFGGFEWEPDLLFLAMNLEFTLIFYMLQEAAVHSRGAANRIS